MRERRPANEIVFQAEPQAARSTLNRRTFLQGTGAVIALPVLESLLPRRVRAATSGATPPVRLVTFYVPCGMLMDSFVPTTTGANYALPSTLQPLSDLRTNFAVISNTSNANSNNPAPGGHAIGTGTWASATPINGDTRVIRAGQSFDQLVASAYGSATRLSSLQLGCYDDPDGDGVYPDTYNSCISWASATSPLKPQFSVATSFKKLFPSGQVQGARANKAVYFGRDFSYNAQHSILDGAVQQTQSLQKHLGTQDAAVLDQYLTSIRELEQSLVDTTPVDLAPTTSPTGTGTSGTPGTPTTGGTTPTGGGAVGGGVSGASCALPSGATFDATAKDFATQAKQYAQLIPLALACDQTRVISFMFAAGESYRVYNNLGINAKHHYISHYNDGESGLGYNGNIAALKKIQTYEVQCFANLLAAMRSVQEGNGTLLDNSVVLFASEFGDSTSHDLKHMPVLLAGGAGGRFKAQGQHLKMADGIRYAQVLLTAIRGCGLTQASFGALGETGSLAGVFG